MRSRTYRFALRIGLPSGITSCCQNSERDLEIKCETRLFVVDVVSRLIRGEDGDGDRPREDWRVASRRRDCSAQLFAKWKVSGTALFEAAKAR